jgi:lipase chaperone LimK
VRVTEEKKAAPYAKLLNRPEGQGERVGVESARDSNVKLAQLKLAATKSKPDSTSIDPQKKRGAAKHRSAPLPG